jgi:cysteinyl-tRNA synthetase
MALELFNTLTRKREEFLPKNPPQVKLYTCGPTVYDYAHIGNFRYFVFVDLLRRYLEFRGYTVTHVMNITDVEDKIIRRAQQEKKPATEITAFYTQEFLRDLDTLRIRRPTHLPFATEHIPEIIAIIQKLIERGVAYQAPDKSIYFSIAKFPRYGQLKKFDAEHMRQGERVKKDEYDKESAMDFALWKAWDADDGDVAWDSPWGRGRPGWHIECSAMSMKYLGNTFDMHCGGEDLIFPHHEDEIAQSEAATGETPFARFWVHCAFLLVEGQKMSKSKGNFYTLRDLLTKGLDARAIRHALVSAHYREQLNFTVEGVHAAKAALVRIDEMLLKLHELTGGGKEERMGEREKGRVGESAAAEKLLADFQTAMDDDLNSSAAFAALFEFVRETNKRIAEKKISAREAQALLAAWEKLDGVLGLGMPQSSEAPPEIQQLLEQRQQARKAKDFKRADQLRDELKAKGWLIEDTPQGARLKKL